MGLKDKRTDLHPKTISGVPFGKEALDFAPGSGPLRQALERAILVRRLVGPPQPEPTKLDETEEPDTEEADSTSTSASAEIESIPSDSASSINSTCSRSLSQDSLKDSLVRTISGVATRCAWCSA